MLTRAYDTNVAAQNTFIVAGEMWDSSQLREDILNCKNYRGTIRHAWMNAINTGGVWYSSGSITLPFSRWSGSGNNSYGYSQLLPDEDSSEPSYEDYQVETSTPTGWYDYNNIKYAVSWDVDTKSWVSSATTLYQNNSGANKTVYGVLVRHTAYYRPNSSTTSSSSMDQFLVAREHFPEPIIVGDQEMLSLTFSWRTTRAGLVVQASAATAAEA